MLPSPALIHYYNEAVRRADNVSLQSRQLASPVSSSRVRISAEEPPINVSLISGVPVEQQTPVSTQVFGSGMCMCGGALYGAGRFYGGGLENTSNNSKQLLLSRAHSRALNNSLSNPLPR